MHDVLNRFYRTKMVLSCLILAASGILLMVAGNLVDDSASWHWLRYLPLTELGGILIGAGLLGVWLDHFLSRERDEIDELRLKRLLHDQAPAMRDAVLEAFAANHQDLARVATPETLDQIISNSLALRLDDAQFAAEIYTDIRDQAIGASERWHDASLSIDLQPLAMARGTAKGGASSSSTSTNDFSVTVRWEYTVVPKHPQRRFVCLSDPTEYAELAAERGATSAWFMQPGNGLDASSPEAYELLRFSVNGQDQAIRRSARKTSQTYTAHVGQDLVDAAQPITISYTYRLVMASSGHLLFFDIEQPTRDLRIDFDYAGCGISSVSTLDLIPSVRPTRIERPTIEAPGDTIRVDLDGWIFPRSGIAFVWSLETEHRSCERKHPLSD